MRIKLKEMLKKYRFAGFQEEAFTKNRSEINSINQEIVSRTSKAGIVIIALLLIFTSTTSIFIEQRLLYLITFLGLSIAIVINQAIIKPKEKQCLPILYLLLIGLDTFASLLGTLNLKDNYATTICVFLTVLPVFILDRPIRISLINLSQWIVFSILAYCLKSKTVAIHDIMNSFLFLICSFFITYQNVHIKLENIVSKGKLKSQRDSDFLTKLNNRRALEKIVNKALEQELDSSAMLLLDIDNFKMVNDTLGHDKGDEVLIMTAQKLKSVFSDSAVISRIGGDEFVVFLPDYEGMSELVAKMGHAMDTMRFEIASEKAKCQVSASMGATLITNKNVNYEMLYKQADIAMYQAKRNGKSGYAIYQTMK